MDGLTKEKIYEEIELLSYEINQLFADILTITEKMNSKKRQKECFLSFLGIE
jgi:hypothetical protein